MAGKYLPSPQALRQLLDYEPETGFLTWKKRGPEWFQDSEKQTAESVAKRWNARYAGQRAFTAKCKGYHVGNIGRGRLFRASRVIWAMVYGEWPDVDVDHKNTISDDDRLDNLRPATSSQNAQNKLGRPSMSGIKGVRMNRVGNWQASITANRKRYHLGTFSTKEAAAGAYAEAAKQLHREFQYSA